MSTNISRRRMLGGALGVSALIGAGLVSQAPSAAAAGTRSDACPNPVIPVVPGMSGSPRANQLWYQFDEVTFYNPSQAFQQAIGAVAAALGTPDIEEGIGELWLTTRNAGTYPAAFISPFNSVQDQLRVISITQIQVFNEYYGCNPLGLIPAMADFGQGILYDPRRPVGSKVHMMSGTPPLGYHVWHAFNRVFGFLDIDAGFWNKWDPVVAYGWAVQSTAKPVADAHNPPLPSSVLASLAAKYLFMPPARIDQAFMSVPYPPGIS
jgi:hypothetical protein